MDERTVTYDTDPGPYVHSLGYTPGLRHISGTAVHHIIERWSRWPRSDYQRIERMDRYVKWKRQRIVERRWIAAFWWTMICIGTPLWLAALIFVWRWLMQLVLG